jgi:hypothetical protein
MGTAALASLQNRLLKTENSLGDHHPGQGAVRYASASQARVLERLSVPNPNQHRGSALVEPGRLRLILQRLRDDFYAVPPASEQIATSVLAELNEPTQGPPALPH